MKPENGFWKRWLVFGGLTLGLTLVIGSLAARAETSRLPGKARQHLNRGLAAAGDKQWDQALQHFEKARQQAPQSPQLLFNLALANDRKGHRELIALAWYRAYLAAAPQQPQAGKVRARAGKLEAQVAAKVRDLLSRAQKAADIGVTDLEFVGFSDRMEEAYLEFSLALAASGDTQGASALAQKVSEPARRVRLFLDLAKLQTRAKEYRSRIIFLAEAERLLKSPALKQSRINHLTELDEIIWELQEKLLEAGDITGAEKLALGLNSEMSRDRALGWIMRAKLDQGDGPGAAKILNSVKDGREKAYYSCSRAVFLAKKGSVTQAMDIIRKYEQEIGTDALYYYQSIVEAQARSGDKKGAGRTLSHLAGKLLKETSTSEWPTAWQLKPLVESYIQIGDRAGARKMLTQAFKAHKRFKKQKYLARELSDLANLQAQTGDPEVAKRTLELALQHAERQSEAQLKNEWLYHLVMGQVQAGEMAEAERTALRISALVPKFNSWAFISSEMAERGDQQGLKRLAGLMMPHNDKLSQDSRWPWLIGIMTRSGNVSIAREMAAALQRPRARHEAYQSIAKAQDLTGDRTGARTSRRLALAALSPQEVDAWTHTGLKKLRQTAVRDWPAVMNSLEKTMDVQVVSILAQAAKELAAGYRIYQQTQANWRILKQPAPY